MSGVVAELIQAPTLGPNMRCFLVDNGSLRIESWRNLCAVAAGVSSRTGIQVEPASVLHSSRIDSSLIPPDVPKPKTWEQAVKAALKEGEREFWTLPFFFGPTSAITEYLPRREAALRGRFGEFSVRYGPFLAEEAPGLERSLVDLLANRVEEILTARGLRRPPVILVDHGSPRREVTAVRDRLATALRFRLGDSVEYVRAASMERRPGAEFAFNEPLLEKILCGPPCLSGDVVVALLFLSPGRHAGTGGDIASICAAAEASRLGLRIHRTALLGDHPKMPDLVAAQMARMDSREV